MFEPSNPILGLILKRFADLYEDTTFKQHEENVKQGKEKHWADMGSFKECEKRRKELLIQRALKDQIPQIMNKLDFVFGYLTWEKSYIDRELFLCKFYINELKRLKNKKKFTYKDSIKVDDLFSKEPSKFHPSRAYINKQVVLGFIEKAIVSDKEFRQELAKIIQTYNLLGGL